MRPLSRAWSRGIARATCAGAVSPNFEPVEPLPRPAGRQGAKTRPPPHRMRRGRSMAANSDARGGKARDRARTTGFLDRYVPSSSLPWAGSIQSAPDRDVVGPGLVAEHQLAQKTDCEELNPNEHAEHTEGQKWPVPDRLGAR